MKGRPPILHTEEETILWFIGIYYRRITEDPDIKFEEREHIKLIEEINQEYKASLKKNKFNEELFEGRFIECIDFLTRIFTKKKEKRVVQAKEYNATTDGDSKKEAK